MLLWRARFAYLGAVFSTWFIGFLLCLRFVKERRDLAIFRTICKTARFVDFEKLGSKQVGTGVAFLENVFLSVWYVMLYVMLCYIDVDA